RKPPEERLRNVAPSWSPSSIGFRGWSQGPPYQQPTASTSTSARRYAKRPPPGFVQFAFTSVLTKRGNRRCDCQRNGGPVGPTTGKTLLLPITGSINWLVSPHFLGGCCRAQGQPGSRSLRLGANFVPYMSSRLPSGRQPL